MLGLATCAAAAQTDADQIGSLDKSVRANIYARTLNTRREAVRAAVRVVQSSNKPLDRVNDPRKTAIELLGDLGAEEAVGDLVYRVEWKDPFAVDAPRGVTCDYPATRALIKIGKPASRSCAARLRSVDDPLTRENLCHVVRLVEGVRGGRLMIEMELERGETALHKKRLAEGLEVYDRLAAERGASSPK